MPDLYLVIVVILIGLAIFDLVVGVSNDAVNFLNSAIGSNAGTRRTILIVATLGILIGATFSSGIMEVARKGIFNPGSFSFADVMVIFVAVMLTDIILLDLFNTFGMPTSTTVSIVFELLGAAVVISLIKMIGAGEPIGALGTTYINSGKALAIISGILLSVGIAFTIGVVVQYISRHLFTFQSSKRMKVVGPVWCGFAMTALGYFLFIKGLKGSSFVTPDAISWVQAHTLLILAIGLVVSWIVMFSLQTFFRINILRLVVLFGTFALAMAFAGNDLVNFIGVAIAGLESYQTWTASGLEPEALAMTGLAAPVQTPTTLLLLAGTIMAVTLWVSSKARSVTETEVNLGRQDEGLERFSPNVISRGIVRMGYKLGHFSAHLLPASLREKLEANLQVDEEPESDASAAIPATDKPAFDLVRGSVNLTTASILISFATSLKLPLSTTYVSFMVAMGTSLADRAWGRDSAVYRVAGVMNVIMGWFITALVAFLASGIFAFLIYQFQLYAIAAILMLVVFIVVKGFFYHRDQADESKRHRDQALHQGVETLAGIEIRAQLAEQVVASLKTIHRVYREAIHALVKGDRTILRQASRDLGLLERQNEQLRTRIVGIIRRTEESADHPGSKLLLQVYDREAEALKASSTIVASSRHYVENFHRPLSPAQMEQLDTLGAAVTAQLEMISGQLKEEAESPSAAFNPEDRSLDETCHQALDAQIRGIKEGDYGSRDSKLIFNLILESEDLIRHSRALPRLFAQGSYDFTG
ncbi:MAG: inorganic phosphate transporter [Akkermansiaceae bacterium]|jgi:phosphate/sulfate permease